MQLYTPCPDSIHNQALATRMVAWWPPSRATDRYLVPTLGGDVRLGWDVRGQRAGVQRLKIPSSSSDGRLIECPDSPTNAYTIRSLEMPRCCTGGD